MSDVEDLAAIVEDAVEPAWFRHLAAMDIAEAVLARNYVIPKRVVDPGLAGDAD